MPHHACVVCGTSALFCTCLIPHHVPSLQRFLLDLHDSSRLVWFFGLYPNRQTLVFLGTCRQLPHLRPHHEDVEHALDLRFERHAQIPPAVPILPSDLRSMELEELPFDPLAMLYTSPYDGLAIINTATMFAIRLCLPEVCYVTPLLQMKHGVGSFLSMRLTESYFMANHRAFADDASQNWWQSTLPMLHDRFFADKHANVLQRVAWHLEEVSLGQKKSNLPLTTLGIGCQCFCNTYLLSIGRNGVSWKRICNDCTSFWITRLPIHGTGFSVIPSILAAFQKQSSSVWNNRTVYKELDGIFFCDGYARRVRKNFGPLG